ncbi:hypothetical protein B0H13DRAFT_1883591 [Mycena leptocephala]|nr:hypothetical protein B0H13DRAFT_1883591 [Mycena leptocephala]
MHGIEFKHLNLQLMGLRIQLGHQLGETCDTPQTGNKNFTVIHNDSIHPVAIDYCRCKDEQIVGSHCQQLLRCLWYPTTHKEPKTCTTFVRLEMFHIMTLQGKDCYKAFMRTMREWQHLMMLKQGAQGNNGDHLVAETRPGELAVMWVNLPEGWESAAPEQSGLAALDYTNTKFSRGYASMDVGLGVCAQHEFVQRNGAADLQKGKRFANMDYIVASLMRHHNPLLPLLMEEISHGPPEKLPPLVRLNLVFNLVRFVIPKLHIYGHKLFCQLLYSLNYTPGAVRTDRDGIERPWANIGPIATSTREMGPGRCQDTLNDHWGHWNWIKLIGLGAPLKKRLLRTILERNSQCDTLTTFTEHQAEHVGGWKAMVEVFEVDNTKPNPYELPKLGINKNNVHMDLAKEEAVEQEGGLLPIHNVSPSAFILAGLDLEEQQHRIKVTVALNKNQSTVYMPGVLQALADRLAPRREEEEAASLVENVPLFLLSALLPELRASGCNKGMDELEVRHQGATTCACNLMNCNDEKIRVQAKKYVAAWEAKCTLVGEDKAGWHQLNPKKDLRCMDSEEDRVIGNRREKCGVGEPATEEDRTEGVGGQRRKNPTGEGTRTISWIWMGADASSSATLEAVLAGEEMGCMLLSLHCKASWWMEQHTPMGFEDVHAEGALLSSRGCGRVCGIWRWWKGRKLWQSRDVDEDSADDEDTDADNGMEREDGSEDEQIVDDEEEGSVGGALDNGEDE